MSQPYGIYVNPYTGYIYGTDAGSFEGAGYLYQWSPVGQLLGKHKVYINPGHFLAVAPAGYYVGIGEVASRKTADGKWYDLHGRATDRTPLQRGNIYIKDGRKTLFTK